jgi:uncharacterized protein (DUF1800 family)
MINTKHPLEEKMALFWHGVFATGYTKLNHPKQILGQIAMFRRHGLGSFRTLLVEVSKDPAMIFWLDNKDSHKEAINENYGEVLELFSMGVELHRSDVRQCARSFTGWTIPRCLVARLGWHAVWPYGRWTGGSNTGLKTTMPRKNLLGHAGPFDGVGSSISSVDSHVAGSSFGISITSSSPMNRRCQPGRPFHSSDPRPSNPGGRLHHP